MGYGRRIGTIVVLLLSLGLPFGALAAEGTSGSINPVIATPPPKTYFPSDIFPDGRYFTLSTDSNQVGPVYPHRTGDRTLTADYVTKVFRHLIIKADQLNHDNPILGYREGSNDNFTYYSFLILALATPHHESHLVHFRDAFGADCATKTNNLMRASQQTRDFLSPIYRNPLTPIFPDCRYLIDEPTVNQLLTSPLGDTGIGQVNPKWNLPAFDPNIMMSTYRSIDYAIHYLWEGFSEIRHSPDKFHCDFDENPFSKVKGTKATPHWGILRATWAGRYNSRDVCRFMQNDVLDVNFDASLLAIARDDSSIFHAYLPEGSLERKAFLEIVANFRAAFSVKKVREQNENLFEMLNEGETNPDWQAPNRLQQFPTSTLLTGVIDLQSNMSNKKGFNCGHLTSAGKGAEKVQVFSTSLDADGQRWSEILIPPMATFADFENKQTSDCSQRDHYYVHSDDLKRLAINIEPGHHYAAVIIGQGHSKTNVYESPANNTNIVDVFEPGRVIEIVAQLTTKSGDQWCEILPADNTYTEGWVRCERSRVGIVSEIKSHKTGI